MEENKLSAIVQIDTTNPEEIRQLNSDAKKILDHQREAINEMDSLSVTLKALKESTEKYNIKRRSLRHQLDEISIEI